MQIAQDLSERKNNSEAPQSKSSKNSPPNKYRRFYISLAIFLLALIIRLVYLYESSACPSFKIPIVDAGTYYKMARILVEEGRMDANFFYQPFFYQCFLSVLYYIFDGSMVAIKIVQALLGGLTCVLTYHLGTKIFNRTTGIVAGVIIACYGPLFFLELELLATGWAAFWSVTLILLFLKTAEKNTGGNWLILGLAGGLSFITRPMFIPPFSVGFFWLGLKYHARLAALARGTLQTLAGILLITLPVCFLAQRIMGRFTFLPSSGGINLYIGNNPDMRQTLTTRPGDDWEWMRDLPLRHGVGNNEWDKDRFFKQLVFDYIKSQPPAFIKGLAYKTIEFINSREIPRNVDVYLFAKWSRLLALSVWKSHGFGFPFGLVLPLAVLGLIYHARRIPAVIILFLWFYGLAIILVFVSGRYRMEVIPLVALLAAAGLNHVLQMIRKRRRRTLLIMSGLAAAVVLISTLPGPFWEEQVNFEAEFNLTIADELRYQDKINDALPYYTAALQMEPDNPEIYNKLGMILDKQMQLRAAIEQYLKALQLKPDYYKAHSNLAVALIKLNQLDGALEHLQAARKLNPFSAQVHFNLAVLFAAQQKYDQALQMAQKALELAQEACEFALAEQIRPHIKFYQAQLTPSEKNREATNEKVTP